MVFVASFSDTRTIQKIVLLEVINLVFHFVQYVLGIGTILVRATIHGAEIVLMYGESNKVWMPT